MTESQVTIDGSLGEGGGQMLRSSLALSAWTGKPLIMQNIRARRDKPGLRPQHLTAVQAAAAICQATVRGGAVGSQSLRFEPGDVVGGEYQFDIGTAGSATLVLQTVLLPLALAPHDSLIRVRGGTHNQAAPPADYLQQVYLPLLARMGPRARLDLDRAGFYPRGGGQLRLHIEPASCLGGTVLMERGALKERLVIARLASLPEHIGQRETKTALRKLGWPTTCGRIEHLESSSPGNAVSIRMEFEHVTEVFTGFGRPGLPAERVAAAAAREARSYLDANVPVGTHLADQLVLPLAISAAQAADVRVRRGGRYCTQPLTDHTRTHLEIVDRFLSLDISLDESDGQATVSIGPKDG